MELCRAMNHLLALTAVTHGRLLMPCMLLLKLHRILHADPITILPYYLKWFGRY